MALPSDRGLLTAVLYFWQLADPVLEAGPDRALARASQAVGHAMGISVAATGSASPLVPLCTPGLQSAPAAVAATLAFPVAVAVAIGTLRAASVAAGRAREAWSSRIVAPLRCCWLRPPPPRAPTTEHELQHTLLAGEPPPPSSDGSASERRDCTLRACPPRLSLPAAPRVAWFGALLLSLLLGYQTAVRALGKLVHCRSVPHAAGQPATVLFYAGGTTCGSWWVSLAAVLLFILAGGPPVLAWSLRGGERAAQDSSDTPTQWPRLREAARSIYMTSGRAFRPGLGWWPALQLLHRFLFATIAAGVRSLPARLLAFAAVAAAGSFSHVWWRPYRCSVAGTAAAALQGLLLALTVVFIPVTLRFDATGGSPDALGAASSVAPALQRFADLCASLQDAVIVTAAAVCVLGCTGVAWMRWRQR